MKQPAKHNDNINFVHRVFGQHQNDAAPVCCVEGRSTEVRRPNIIQVVYRESPA